MGFEDVADGRIADMVTNIGQRALNTIEAPVWVFSGESQYKIHDDLPHTRSSRLILSAIRVIPFLCDELSMPTENRIWCYDRGEIHQSFAAERLPLDGQKPPLVIRQKNPLFAKFLEQSLNLGILKLDDLLLTLIHPRRYHSMPNAMVVR